MQRYRIIKCVTDSHELGWYRDLSRSYLGAAFYILKEDIMKKLTGNQVRQLFLDFFESKGHKVEPSHSLIPNGDPTLLWINSGVAALKKYFDGTITPDVPRITNAQKSIRTNDIENVGVTARHHTFFEMLGNFSIGDYFKKEAIDFAWEFLTGEQWLAFEKDKLYITVYQDDEEAYEYWVNVKGVHPDHMLKTEGNFWEIGEGPCGPDSEIFYDRGEKYDPDHIGTKLFYEELENDRYVEIWNLVFSQFNAKEGVDRRDYQELPKKNIDTGMGLERIVSIIQEGETNFDTDFFLPTIKAAEKLAKVSYEQDKMAYRIIADHIRTVTFALADGAQFDNEGRGYVLRRILRRAVRYGKKIGIEGTFMFNLVDVVSDIMKEFYTYLPEKVEYIKKLVKIEEERFHATLSGGEKMLSEIIANTKGDTIDGKTAFKLYDTYGFPFELTLEIAAEHQLKVDEEGFKEEMRKQKERARNARGGNESMGSQKEDLMKFVEPSAFTYDPTPLKAKVIGLFKDGKQVDVLEDSGEIIFDHTNFYAQMGGQCADQGTIKNETTALVCTNVLKAPNGQHLHYVEIKNGQVKVGDELTLEIDMTLRNQTQNNHTATHLLQAALKEVLGSHIAQAGSYVDAQRLRFDFTHYEKLSKEELNKIESIVNDKIFAAYPVNISHMSKDEAIASGAIALFDEKYGDEVRVVNISEYSVELCGGCHVSNTSAIGIFKIEMEESIGSGIRRIEAVTGKAAYTSLNHAVQTVDAISDTLKLKNKAEVLTKVEALQTELNESKKENEKLRSKLNSIEAKEKLSSAETINGIPFLLVNQEQMSANEAKQLAFEYRSQLGSGIVALVNVDEDKATYYVAVSEDIVAKGYKAGDLVKAACAASNGRGGGKPDFAQGGTKELDKVLLGISEIKKAL